MYRTAFNPTTGPQVSSVNGHTIGGGEWGVIETTDDQAQAALERGVLVLITEPEDVASASAEAGTIIAESRRREDRRGLAGAMSKDELVAAARAAGMLGENDPVPNRPELETQLIESDAELSAPDDGATEGQAQSTASDAPDEETD